MLALILSDVHEEFSRFDVGKLPDADVCFIAGDITNYGLRGTQQSLYKARTWLYAIAQRYNKVFCIPGNHDIHFGNKPFTLPSNVEYIMDRTVTWKGIKIHGVSLTVAYNMPEIVSTWDYMTIRPEVEAAAFDFEAVNIVLSHGPPFSVRDEAGYDLMTKAISHAGSPELLKYIDKYSPEFVFCGHIHESFGVEYRNDTCVLNTARHACLVDLSNGYLTKVL